jgi:hypothetical protein
MQTPSPAPIEYVSNLKRALIFKQITERDFYPFAAGAPGRSLLSSTVPGTQTLIDQTYRAWAYGQMSSAIVSDPQKYLGPNDSFGGPAPSDFVDDLRRSLLYGGITYTDLGGFFIPPYGATFWRDFRLFQTLNHGVGIPLSYSRPSFASYIDQNQTMQISGPDEPRFDYDPFTGEFKGLLIEGGRTNFVLNSEVGTNQTVNPSSSGAFTFSFYGSGTVTLSGNLIDVIVGSGSFPNRVSRTYNLLPGFTSFNITCSGDVRYLQLESGSIPTSWIPTGGTFVTRQADNIASQTSGFDPSVYNPSEGTLYASFVRYGIGSLSTSGRNPMLYFRRNNNNSIGLTSGTVSNSQQRFVVQANNVNNPTVIGTLPQTANIIYKVAGKYSSTVCSLFQDATLSRTVSGSFPLPTGVSNAAVGNALSTYLFGHIRELAYMPSFLSDSDMIDLTTP